MIISEFKAVVDILRQLQQAGKNEGLRALTEPISDAVNRLSGLQLEFVELRSENLALREELGELKRGQDVRERVRFDGDCYRLVDPPAGRHGGPFCVRCWEADSTLMTVHVDDATGWWCVGCKSRRTFESPEARRFRLERIARPLDD